MKKILCVIFAFSVCLVSNAQTIKLYKKGVLVRDYSSSEVDSIVLGKSSSQDTAKVFYCGKNRSLPTLKAGIEAATRFMDATLYVDDGTYDLIEEFGSNYFEDLNENSVLSGLMLKNRVHVIFSKNSKVVSHYKGTNKYAMSLYSPFNVGEYGFYLENLNLECSNCRYAVHDERNGGKEKCISSYFNCSFSIDNGNNTGWPNGSTDIGGGLGSDAEVVFDNCTFTLIGDDDPRNAIYYHQSNDMSNPNHKCNILIKNCYMYQGTVTLDFYRTDATEYSYVEIYNNSFGKVRGAASNGLFLGGRDSLPDDVHTYLKVWGNEIRNE